MPHPPLRRALACQILAGSVLVGSVLAGCSGSGGGDEAAPTPTGSPAGGVSPTAGATAPGAEPGAPVASRTSRIQGADGDVDVGFVALRVDGRLVQLDLLFTPRYADDPGTQISLYEMAGRRDAAVTLVDTTNLLRYTVVHDSGGAALGAAAGTTRTRNNVPVTTSFTYAAPPAEVTSVDVYLNDRLIVDDAPITR